MSDGLRFWVTDHGGNNFARDITQVSLDVAFSTSSFTIDGTVDFDNSGSGGAPQPSGLTFSTNGLKMYTMNDEDEDVCGNDSDDGDDGVDDGDDCGWSTAGRPQSPPSWGGTES